MSEALRTYMKASVDDGTSKYAKVEGYSMGGKTGTAQKIPRGNGKYLVSWVGFVPFDDPQVVIYCVIDEPNVADQADNRFPQWVARDILREILPYLGIYPDEAPDSTNEYLSMDFNNPTGDRVITSAMELDEEAGDLEGTAQGEEDEEPKSYIASIDEDGNLLNADGHFIDAEGYLINDDLLYVDENDNVVDEAFKIRAGEKSRAPKAGAEENEEDLGTPTADTVADTNVPEVQGMEDEAETAGGNTLETDGYTNEEAGLQNEEIECGKELKMTMVDIHVAYDCAALIAFAICAALGPFVIPFLRKLKMSQTERTYGMETHLKKAGTPTMGGVMILAAFLVACLILSAGPSQDRAGSLSDAGLRSHRLHR